MDVLTLRALGRTTCLLALAGLAACGGGGGGGTTGAVPGLVFTPDKTSITLTYDAGLPTATSVVITATGTYSGTIYVGATVEGQGISPNIPATIGGTQATFQLTGNGAIPAGDYTGRVSLLACADANCAQQIGNSPVTISYTVHVLAPLVVTPTAVNTSVVSGTPASQVLTVGLPSGATTSVATVTQGAPWLTATSTTATSVQLTLASLPSGTYTGAVTVAAGSKSAMVPVNYTVAAPPGGDHGLSASPTSLTLATTEGATSPATSLAVTPPSWDSRITPTVGYSGAATGWLIVTPTPGGYSVAANAAALRAGTYSATLTLAGAYPSTPVVLPVSVTVGLGLVRPATIPVTLGAETTAAALSGSVPINVVAGPPTTWQASSNTDWLLLGTTSGTTGGALQFSLDAARLDALPNNAVHSATVTITPGNATMTAMTFDIQVHKALPEVTSVNPHVQLAGRPLRTILRGNGFDSIANLGARFAIQGGAITSATRINDTEVILNLGALSAGSHAVTVSNALGMAAQASPLVAIVTPAFAPAQVPTGGIIPSLAFDAERNALYAANVTLESVMRFRYGSGTWSADSMPLPAAYDVGLTPDGSQLIVARSSYQANTGAIGLVDPAATTMTLQRSLALASHIEPTFLSLGFGLRTTNDGNTWLGVGNQWATLMAFRASDSSLTAVAPANTIGQFYSGPWSTTSRDGERLVMVQSASISPTPPMLYMDAADGAFKVNPAGLLFSYHLSLSDDGGRLMLDMQSVRDHDFNLVGNITLPTSPGVPDYIARTGILSPDGSRAYVLAYRLDLNLSPVLPRVFVYDSSLPPATQAQLPLLGYFDLPAYPTCIGDLFAGYAPCAATEIAAAISIDGGTLFFASSERLVVQPVPATLNAVAARLAPVIRSGRPQAYTPWPLELH